METDKLLDLFYTELENAVLDNTLATAQGKIDCLYEDSEEIYNIISGPIEEAYQVIRPKLLKFAEEHNINDAENDICGIFGKAKLRIAFSVIEGAYLNHGDFYIYSCERRLKNNTK